jgi:hypothetical protein
MLNDEIEKKIKKYQIKKIEIKKMRIKFDIKNSRSMKLQNKKIILKIISNKINND